MFCPKCGKQLPENAAFCGFCGANIAEHIAPAATAQPVQQPVTEPVQQPAQTQPTYEKTVVLENPASFTAYAQEAAVPVAPVKIKKPRSKKLIAFLAVILAIAAIVSSVMFIPSLRRLWEEKVARPVEGALVENFGSEEDYLQFVEKEAFEGYDGYVNTVSTVYGTIVDTVTDKTYADTTISVEISDAALELIQEALGDSLGDIDLSFLNNIEYDLGIGLDKDFVQVNTAFGINGKTILDPSFVMDFSKGEILISILSLSDKYIRADMDIMGIPEMSSVTEYLDMFEKYADALPSESELDSLIDKYIGIVLDELDEVEKGSEKLEIGEITEKLTTVELGFTSEMARDILVAVLSEAKNDKTIKKYIGKISKLLEEDGLIPDADEIYEYYVEAVESALANFEEVEVDDEVLFTLVDYVDSDHKVVGRKLFMGDDTDAVPVVFYGTVHDGKKYEFEFVITGVDAAQVYISGNGVDKGGVLTGDYTVALQGMDLLKFSLEDFDMNALKSGKMKGTVILTPSKELVSSMGVGNVEMYGISMADLSIGLVLDVDGTSADVTVNALVDGEVFAGVRFQNKMTKAPSVKTPSEKNVVDINDAEEWVASIDLERFVNNLKSAGLPKEITEALDELMENIDSPEDLFGGAVSELQNELMY